MALLKLYTGADVAEEGNTENQRAEMATNHPVSFMEVWIGEVGGWCVLKGVGWVEGLGGGWVGLRLMGGWGLSVFRGIWWV